MKRSMSYSESDHAHKKPKTEDDASDSSTMTSPFTSRIPESDLWTVTRFLGKGSYGSVHLAERTTKGKEAYLPQEMVIKTTELSQSSQLQNEKRFLKLLETNPYVVSYHGKKITHDKKTKKAYYNTILEYCPSQCLAKHIKRHNGIGLPEEDVKRFALDILIGLRYTHAKKIIHCDIKPKNILLADESTGLRGPNGLFAKISGFGKAMEKGSTEYGDGWGHRRGTTRFMSPELIVDKVLDYGVDVWAFGCTVLEMLTGERVWSEHGELVWEDWIDLIGVSDLVPYMPGALSEEAKDFVSKCLEKEPSERWSVDSLMKHPFLSWTNQYAEEEEEEEEEEIFDEEEEEVYEEEAIEIDEEYPKEDWEEEDL
ncbi:unnamed protein product [Eruca vesicaria subsp. sativa]|uniref:Protein kinase domain-containing protein n=1 Tax=Eruca vesicaria subsp. sativa TaxID=29727 RepID=A0ABC8J1G9_ERUVS|nr:unnamed protein product [Eruca vesicaria subsp. sativa]